MKLNLKIGTLIVAAFGLFASCTPDNPDTGNGGSNSNNANPFTISVVSSSTTGATLSWSANSGDNTNYTISIYTDEGCTDLYQQYTLVFANDAPKRFSIPYLNCNSTFYACIENNLGQISNPVEISLSNSIIRRNVIALDFDNFYWGYDYMNMAQGVILADQDPKTYILEVLTDARQDSTPTSNIEDNGGLISRYRESMRVMMGFEGWDSSKEVRILPGYAKLGTAFEKGTLKSPAFTALEEESIKVDVSFSACIYAVSMQANGGAITAKIVNGSGRAICTKDLNMSPINGTPSWNHFSFSAEGVTSDCHLEISTTDQAKQVCIDNVKVVRSTNVPNGHIYGYLYDKESGAPIKDVAISDGYNITTSDKDGFYTMKPHKDTYYIYYSIPANCKVVRKNGHPSFYTIYDKNVQEYNFELQLMPNSLPEEKFALVALSDTYLSSSTTVKRFKNEAIPAISEHVKSLNIPCYGVSLGDHKANNTGSLIYLNDYETGNVHELYKYNSIGMPMFLVMGNYDCPFFNEKSPLEGDDFELKAQRTFEGIFGPINYSFNRGNAHIIAMRNFLYTTNTTTANCKGAFTPEQIEWLKQDLACVPTDKMIVLCVHFPIFDFSNEDSEQISEILATLNEYPAVHILSGHKLAQRNFQYENYNIYEHNIASISGDRWTSNICGDGSPIGYSVFISEGNDFSDWYYTGYTKGLNRNNQMRIYKGNAITIPANSKFTIKGK